MRSPAGSTIEAPPRAALWLIGGALVLATLVVYAPVRAFEFVGYDDPLYVTDNEAVRGGVTAGGITWAFSTFRAGNWHPLTWLSHMLDVSLFGLHPSGHHLASVVLHAASTLVLFLVLARMTGAAGRSAFVAGVFALHPLHVQSVAWVAERKDVLSTLFWFLALGAYAGYSRHPDRVRYARVLVLLALGLLAKPMLVSAPFVFLLLDVWPLRRWDGSRGTAWALVREKIPLLALAAATGVITAVAQRVSGAMRGLDAVDLWTRAGNAVASYGAYLHDAFWPRDLAFYYPLVPVSPTQVATVALLLVAISGAVLARPYLAVGWSWFVVTLVPVIGLVQVGGQGRADRYMYVPIVGLAIVAAWGVADLVPAAPWRQTVLRAVAVAVLAACAAATSREVLYWRNSEALFRRAVEVAPDSYTAQYNLAVTLGKKGDDAGAVPHYVRALDERPRDPKALGNLANALFRIGQLDDAAGRYRELLAVKPDAHEPLTKLAYILATHPEAGKRDPAEAVRLAERAASLTAQRDPMVLNVLSLACAGAGQRDRALDAARRALELAAGPGHEALRAELARRISELQP